MITIIAAYNANFDEEFFVRKTAEKLTPELAEQMIRELTEISADQQILADNVDFYLAGPVKVSTRIVIE